MDPARVEQIVAGFARACSEFACPLIGGETAEMPGTYAPDDYDLAGFIVGVVEKEKALPRGVSEGDVLLGLPSLGLHTNGYSLARKVLFETLGHKASTRLCPSSAPRSARRCWRRTRATSPPSSRSWRATRSGRSPTSRAAASPATSRACCPTGWARCCGAGPGTCRRSSG